MKKNLDLWIVAGIFAYEIAKKNAIKAAVKKTALKWIGL